MNIGQRLQEIRKNLGFSSTELSTRSGVAQSFISKVERGVAYPTTETLEKLLDALNLSFTEFFSEDDLDSELIKWINVGKELSSDERDMLIKTIFLLKQK